MRKLSVKTVSKQVFPSPSLLWCKFGGRADRHCSIERTVRLGRQEQESQSVGFTAREARLRAIALSKVLDSGTTLKCPPATYVRAICKHGGGEGEMMISLVKLPSLLGRWDEYKDDSTEEAPVY